MFTTMQRNMHGTTTCSIHVYSTAWVQTVFLGKVHPGACMNSKLHSTCWHTLLLLLYVDTCRYPDLCNNVIRDTYCNLVYYDISFTLFGVFNCEVLTCVCGKVYIIRTRVTNSTGHVYRLHVTV